LQTALFAKTGLGGQVIQYGMLSKIATCYRFGNRFSGFRTIFYKPLQFPAPGAN